MGGKERQLDIVNDPWPPGLTENWVQQLVMLLGQSKEIVQPALLEEPDKVISYISVYIFQAKEHVKPAGDRNS